MTTEEKLKWTEAVLRQPEEMPPVRVTPPELRHPTRKERERYKRDRQMDRRVMRKTHAEHRRYMEAEQQFAELLSRYFAAKRRAQEEEGEFNQRLEVLPGTEPYELYKNLGPYNIPLRPDGHLATPEHDLRLRKTNFPDAQRILMTEGRMSDEWEGTVEQYLRSFLRSRTRQRVLEGLR